MVELDLNVRCDWKKNDIIRNKETGHPYLVIHVSKAVATILVDLQDNEPLPITRLLLARDYAKYTLDLNMEAKSTLSDTIQWNYNPLPETV
jgi:hypothetical protein